MDFVLDAILRMPRKMQFGPRRAETEFAAQIVDTWRGSSFDVLRQQYLPDYLSPLVDEWKAKISANKYAEIGRAWNLFADMNHVEFVQHMFPTANTKGRYTRVDSTLYVYPPSPLTRTLLASRSCLPHS